MSTQAHACKNCSHSFEITPDDFSFYEKLQVPPPTWCPECRLKRRFAHRNERALYKRKCDLCGESIIAVFSPSKPYKVYCPKCWHSDKWDALSYGREYDPSRLFFEQFRELQLAVPHLSLLQENAVNSPWINYETDDKNCYLNFGGHLNEDCAYNQYNLKTKDCLDNFWLMKSEYGYESILCENSYRIMWSTFCYDCRDTYASLDCRNCSNIIGCTGLRHKQYHIFNEPVSKEEYETFVKENMSGSYEKHQALLHKAREFWKSRPQRATFIEKSVNCKGHLIFESKNCSECLSVEKGEDSKYAVYVLESKDSQDITSIWKSELCYDSIGAMSTSSVLFTAGALDSASRVQYSKLVFACQDCFGCINIKKKQYCILNTQYSKSEYEKLRDRIIADMRERGEYGEFFSPSLSLFSYDETVAYEWFPMTKEEVVGSAFGGNWDDHESASYQFSDYQIPDRVHDVHDDILEKVLKCKISGKAYRITPMELAFYRRFNIPIPLEAPFERHHRRLRFITDHRTLRPRECASCHAPIQSVYSKEEFPIVYCEECYQKEVI